MMIMSILKKMPKSITMIKAAKKTPMRKCVGCQEMKTKKELIRIIRTPEGKIVLDDRGKQNGRGAYLCPDPSCLARAKRSKGLERSLKTAIPEDIYHRLEEELKKI